MNEKGRIIVKEIGFPLEWDDADACIKLLNVIARGEGFGQEAGMGECLTRTWHQASKSYPLLARVSPLPRRQSDSRTLL